MVHELTLADVFTHMGMDSARLRDVLEKYYKDAPRDHVVTIADHVNDRTKRFTVGELQDAEHDLFAREQSPKIANEESFKLMQENSDLYLSVVYAGEKIKSDKNPSLELLIENKIALQCCPNHVFHDPIDNTIFPVATHSRAFETYEDIDWSDVRILYMLWQKENDTKYYMQYLNHEKVEYYKKNNLRFGNSGYGKSRVL